MSHRTASALTHDLQFRMALVSYATADAQPTPLLAKRFFADLQTVTKELKDAPLKLGIGRTTSGRSGMAALEGLVAAVEVSFGLRHTLRPLSKTPTTSRV